MYKLVYCYSNCAMYNVENIKTRYFFDYEHLESFLHSARLEFTDKILLVIKLEYIEEDAND